MTPLVIFEWIVERDKPYGLPFGTGTHFNRINTSQLRKVGWKLQDSALMLNHFVIHLIMSGLFHFLTNLCVTHLLNICNTFVLCF